MPSLPKFDPPTESNPETLAKFRKESWWQITFPLIVVVILMVGCMVGVYIFSGSPGTSIVADYAIILWTLPMLLGGLLTTLLLMGCIYGVLLLMASFPPYAYVVQKALFTVRDRVVSVSNQITGMMIQILSVIGVLTQFIKNLTSPSTKTPSDTPSSKQ